MNEMSHNTVDEIKTDLLQTDFLYLKFPSKLWKLLHECKTGAIRWGKYGKTILIDYGLFQSEYLESNVLKFKTRNMTSFIRQLNMYGFKKVNTKLKSGSSRFCNIHEFLHPSFQYGRHELLNKIKRRYTTSKNSYSFQFDANSKGKTRVNICRETLRKALGLSRKLAIERFSEQHDNQDPNTSITSEVIPVENSLQVESYQQLTLELNSVYQPRVYSEGEQDSETSQLSSEDQYSYDNGAQEQNDRLMNEYQNSPEYNENMNLGNAIGTAPQSSVDNYCPVYERDCFDGNNVVIDLTDEYLKDEGSYEDDTSEHITKNGSEYCSTEQEQVNEMYLNTQEDEHSPCTVVEPQGHDEIGQNLSKNASQYHATATEINETRNIYHGTKQELPGSENGWQESEQYIRHDINQDFSTGNTQYFSEVQKQCVDRELYFNIPKEQNFNPEYGPHSNVPLIKNEVINSLSRESLQYYSDQQQGSRADNYFNTQLKEHLHKKDQSPENRPSTSHGVIYDLSKINSNYYTAATEQNDTKNIYPNMQPMENLLLENESQMDTAIPRHEFMQDGIYNSNYNEYEQVNYLNNSL